MKVNQGIKILVGLATIWFTIYPVLMLALWLVQISNMVTGATSRDDFFSMFELFNAIFVPLGILTFIVQIGLYIFYVIHLVKNKAAAETVRIILGVGMALLPTIAMPAYYFIYVLDQPPAWALASPPTAS